MSNELPDDPFELCTPKLDAILDALEHERRALSHALILDTERRRDTEPLMAGPILERRLRERSGLGERDIRRVPYLSGQERLEDIGGLHIERAVRDAILEATPQHVIVAATGGPPEVRRLVEQIVRLYASSNNIGAEPIRVPDAAAANRSEAGDHAIQRHWHKDPAASSEARRHALDLVARGNLIAAWGAVQHLDCDQMESCWTRVLLWLCRFAAALPMPDGCDIPLLADHGMKAARSAVRVELALRAGDTPRAVQGTVAFFESALWEHLERKGVELADPKRRLYRIDPPPPVALISKKGNPFQEENTGGGTLYRVMNGKDADSKLVKEYLQSPQHLARLCSAVAPVRRLRNEAAHSEPTPAIMEEARRRMVEAEVWTSEMPSRFLTTALVRNALTELGQTEPERLCDELIDTVRDRLTRPSVVSQF